MASILENKEDSLTLRVFEIVSKADKNNANRRKKMVRFLVEEALPMMTTIPSYLDENTRKTENAINVSAGDKDAKFFIHDEEWSNENGGGDRFVFIGMFKSIITLNRVILYYDKKYKDIIIVPNIEFMTLLDDQYTIDMRGSCLGSGTDVTKNPHNTDTIHLDASSHHVLPQPPASPANLSSKLLTFSGFAPAHMIRNTSLEENMTDAKGTQCVLISPDNTPFMAIYLGTVQSFFGNTGRIPLYLLGQFTQVSYSSKYAGLKTPRATDPLFVIIRF